MTLTRRDAMVMTAAVSAIALSGIGAAHAQEGQTVDVGKLMSPKGPPDRFLGPEDAKVTVVEYASPTCPHCATFHNNVYPAFKSQYIDTGKVKFVLRPFVRNVLDAVVFMLAEAAASSAAPADGAAHERYFSVVETFFKTQETWATSESPRDAILVIAKQLGFTEESFEAALTNQDLFAGMESLRDQALEEFGLTGTPTFYVNGKQLSGDKTLEEMAAAIDPLLV